MRGDIQQQQKNPRISQQSDIVSTRWYRGTRVVSRLQALLSTSSGEVQDNECTRERDPKVVNLVQHSRVTMGPMAVQGTKGVSMRWRNLSGFITQASGLNQC